MALLGLLFRMSEVPLYSSQHPPSMRTINLAWST